jgi:hypothetical protein
LIDKKKQKILDRLSVDIQAYLNKGGEITSLPLGETEIYWRDRLNPDTKIDRGDEEDADLDSQE